MGDDGAIRFKFWSIHDVCEEINGGCRGTSDPLDDNKLREYADWLMWRIEHWTPTSEGVPAFIRYDDSVRAMVADALLIAREELRRRKERP